MDEALVYPMFAMVILTFSVLLRLFAQRSSLVAKCEVSAAYYRTYSTCDQEPAAALKLSRHFKNLFEVPTLFYAVCVLVMITGQTDIFFIASAWAYVACRVAHAYIHTGQNRLRPRIFAYFSGWVVLLVMWTYLVIQIAVLS